jgi:hypothetical protein
MEFVRDVSDLDHLHAGNMLPCYKHVNEVMTSGQPATTGRVSTFSRATTFSLKTSPSRSRSLCPSGAYLHTSPASLTTDRTSAIF